MCQARLSRCLRLLTMLQSRLGYSAEDLAHECEVSKRTIYRDLSLMAASGMPVCYDAGRRGYVLRMHSNIRAPGLSNDELATLLLAAHIFSLSCDREISRPIRQAIGKLLGQGPAVVREEISALLNAVGGIPAATLWPRGSQRVIKEILTALRQKRYIRIVYHPPDKSASSLRTKVTPHQLMAAEGHWYLIGRSSWHRRVCRFDLRHIRWAEQTDSASESVESPSLSHATTHHQLAPAAL